MSEALRVGLVTLGLLIWAGSLGQARAQSEEPVDPLGAYENAAEAEMGQVDDDQTNALGDDAEGETLNPPPDQLETDEFDPALGDATVPDDGMDLSGVEEITVTANKRAQNIQDVPISITALGSQTIRDTGITQFSQLQNFVPNLQILPSTDTRSTSVRIRGIGSVGNNAGIDPSVGIFIDGVYQGRAGMSVGDLLDIERVEVLRGPQGTLYGKNTAAGAINILTKRPSYDFETFLEAVVGNYNQLEFRGSVNAPIVEDKLSLRLSGFKVKRDGFDLNTFTGQRVNDANQYGVRGKLAWDVNEFLTLELRGDFSEQNTASFVADIIDYKAMGPTLTGIAFGNLAANAGVPLPPADPFDNRVTANVAPKNIVRVGGVALDTMFEWQDHDFRWLNAWRTYFTDSRFDGDFSFYDAVLAFQDVDLNQYSSELTVTSPEWDDFEYQSGLFFYYSDMHTIDRNGWEQGLVDTARGLGGQQALLFGLFGPVNNINENRHETLSAALYGEATYSIFDSLKLTGGLRVTYEQKSRFGTSTTSPPVAGIADAPPILGPPVTRSETRSVTNVQGRAVLRWYPLGDDTMLYASVANGFKSGGFNQLRVSTSSSSEFDDEKSYTYEGGLRTQWFDRTVTANITGYFTDYDDFQAQTFDGATINVRNAGKLESKGFEADVNYRPDFIDNLMVGTQVGFNIAEYVSFAGAENTVLNQTVIASQQPGVIPLLACGAEVVTPGGTIGGLNCSQNLAGRTLDNAPRWTVTAFMSYEYPVPQYPVMWFLRSDYTYTGEQFLAQDLDPNLFQEGYHLLNIRTGFRSDDDLWELTLWMTNVSDSDYLVTGFDIPIVSGFAGVKAPPRQYGGTLRIRF